MENENPSTEAPEATSSEAPAQEGGKFRPDMTVAEAMALHERAKEVFASFHLGGCSHCAISGHESVRQVCMGYGVPEDVLLEALNGLLES